MQALIIDDSRAMRRILRGIMQGIGFEVVEAEHGKDGIDKLENDGPFDVALVDWNMPVMNGIEFVRFVRGESQYEKLRLVMVTTETAPCQMAKALMAGVDEFVMKPFTTEILVDKLRLIGVSVATSA